MDSLASLLSLVTQPLKPACVLLRNSLAVFLMMCVWADAHGQDSVTTPARNGFRGNQDTSFSGALREGRGIGREDWHEGRRQDSASGLRPTQCDL